MLAIALLVVGIVLALPTAGAAEVLLPTAVSSPDHDCPDFTEQHGRYTVWIESHYVTCGPARRLFRALEARLRAGAVPVAVIKLPGHGRVGAEYRIKAYTCELFGSPRREYALSCTASRHRRIDLLRFLTN